MQKPIPLGAPTGVEYLTRYSQYRQALAADCLETAVREELQVWQAELPRLRQQQHLQRWREDLSNCLA